MTWMIRGKKCGGLINYLKEKVQNEPASAIGKKTPVLKEERKVERERTHKINDRVSHTDAFVLGDDPK